MIDKTIPSYSLSLYKTDTTVYPRFELPHGFCFAYYRPGNEASWAKLECELGQFETIDEATECFKKEFLIDQTLDPRQRMLFVKDEGGEIVATATLWNGLYLGKNHQRIHWVAVSDRCAGKGIAKAMLTRLMDMYNELGYQGYIHLWTGTRNYPAISIYQKFGFELYRGECNPISNLPDFEFQKNNEIGIKLLEEKLVEYQHRK